MIKNEAILDAIYMIEDYKNGVHFLDKTVERIISGLRLLDKELEAQEANGCEGCKYNYDIDNFDSIDGKRLDSFRPNECYVCSRNMNDRYEPKEQ